MKHTLARIVVWIVAPGLTTSCGGSGVNGAGSPGSDGGNEDGTTTGDGSGSSSGTSSGSGSGVDSGTPVDSGRDSTGSAPADSGSDAASESGSSTVADSAPPCTGLSCQIHACADGGSTTISGTIYDPAGKNPLYGVVAYVPNGTPSPITTGATCYSCSQLYTGDPLAMAVSDTAGNFTLTGVPDGTNIPLVIQVGKWRRQFVLPSVPECQNTPVKAGTLTLPKNGIEGDMPAIAVSTGSADTLECLLARVGVDQAEYVPGASGTGHIHIFQGNSGAPNTSPGAPVSATSLWDTDADLERYDLVLLSCEGQETLNMNQQALVDYTTAGGRVFASHFHYAWFDTGPFAADNLATWTPGDGPIGASLNADIVTTFAVGQSFQDWLQNVGALTNGELPIQAPRHNANVTAANTPSQAWIVADNDSQSPGAAQDFTFDTPVGVPATQQCGRVAYSDMHVGAADGDYAGGTKTTPAGCALVDLSPQEKALEFILFDLSSCVTPLGGTTPPTDAGTGAADSGGGDGSANHGFECTIPSSPPSGGSCVGFTTDAGRELDAGLDDAGNASRTTCNPVTNDGCTGTDVCGVDNSGDFYICTPPGSPAGLAACADCASQTATCGAGTLCVGTSTTSAFCAQMCCTNADCGSGTCDETALVPALPKGVGICTDM